MGWYSDECLQITDEFEFDHKKEVHWELGINETVTDIWILNKKKQCLLRMKNVYNGMRKEVNDLENKYYRKLDREDSEGLKELKEANLLIEKKRSSR